MKWISNKALVGKISHIFFLTFLFLTVSCSPTIDRSPSIILCIGDGMGFEQIKAANYYYYGEEGHLSFESFPVHREVATYSADSEITDSAAAATAMATGVKVNNGVISKRIPGNGEDLFTLLEYFQDRGKSVGLVTRDQLSAADFDSTNYFAGLFGDNHLPYEYDGLGDLPHLSEMVSAALEFLDRDRDGFFLLVEGGRIDHACHGNDLERAIAEVGEFSSAVEMINTWAQTVDRVLVIVTADHETGGLSVTNNGTGTYPGASWSTDYHTGVNVPLFAFGYRSELFWSVEDNSDIHDALISVD